MIKKAMDGVTIRTMRMAAEVMITLKSRLRIPSTKARQI